MAHGAVCKVSGKYVQYQRKLYGFLFRIFTWKRRIVCLKKWKCVVSCRQRPLTGYADCRALYAYCFYDMEPCKGDVWKSCQSRVAPKNTHRYVYLWHNDRIL